MDAASARLWVFDAPNYHDFTKPERRGGARIDQWFASQPYSGPSRPSYASQIPREELHLFAQQQGPLPDAPRVPSAAGFPLFRPAPRESSATEYYTASSSSPSSTNVYLNSPSVFNRRRHSLFPKRRDMKREFLMSAAPSTLAHHKHSVPIGLPIKPSSSTRRSPISTADWLAAAAEASNSEQDRRNSTNSTLNQSIANLDTSDTSLRAVADVQSPPSHTPLALEPQSTQNPVPSNQENGQDSSPRRPRDLETHPPPRRRSYTVILPSTTKSLMDVIAIAQEQSRRTTAAAAIRKRPFIRPHQRGPRTSPANRQAARIPTNSSIGHDQPSPFANQRVHASQPDARIPAWKSETPLERARRVLSDAQFKSRTWLPYPRIQTRNHQPRTLRATPTPSSQRIAQSYEEEPLEDHTNVNRSKNSAWKMRFASPNLPMYLPEPLTIPRSPKLLTRLRSRR
ncbi:hypothetical protein BC940DRAFT_346321 [Gongronella butleri]|nr:hypothetical protein BC940DRAFT_346321 [Gongronella butleri]